MNHVLKQTVSLVMLGMAFCVNHIATKVGTYRTHRRVKCLTGQLHKTDVFHSAMYDVKYLFRPSFACSHFDSIMKLTDS